MSQQAAVDALTARLVALSQQIATIEANATANAQPPVDLTALTNEVTAVEGVVAAGLPASAPVAGS